MDTRGVIGQTIVRVEQRRVRQDKTAARPGHTSVEYIELANGVRLVPMTHENENNCYHTDFYVHRARKP
jgi:hypothetical protein